jgi:hypothetical protein
MPSEPPFHVSADDPELDRMQRVVDAARSYLVARRHKHDARLYLEVVVDEYLASDGERDDV